MTLDLFATTNPADTLGANLMAALRWHRDNGAPQPDLALHVDPDPDRPRMSRGAQREAMRAPLLRINADGWGNDGRHYETWEHDGRVEVIG